jgi:tape measure domain-containing protein
MANDNKSLELQIRVATQEALRAVSALKGEVQGLAAEADKFQRGGGAAMKGSFREAEEAAKGTAHGIGDIRKALGSLAEVAAAAKALSLVRDMGAFALQAADGFQAAKNQFGTLLGDMEAGAGLFNEIKAFNDVTPFDLDTLTQATNVLIAAKVPLQDLQAQLTKFGDLSQGNSQKMTSYVNAFSQAAAKGKADMQVLNTYLHQGVPILDALAKNFGVTTAEIVEMSSKGLIGFADFSRALDSLTSAGGQYFGGMELASQSLAAMQEGLREATNSLAASFGEMLLPAAIAVVETLANIANAINESPILKGVLAGALVALTGYLAAVAVKSIAAFAAQMSLNFAVGAMNPVVLATTIAVAGIAAGYTVMAANAQKAARESENLALEQRKQKDAIDATTESAMAFAEALGNMSGENLDRNIRLIDNEIREIRKNIEEFEELYARNIANGNRNRANYWADLLETERENLERSLRDLASAQGVLGERRTGFIDSMFGNTQAGKIEKINAQLAQAVQYLAAPGLNGGEKSKLQEIVQMLTADLERLTDRGDEANRMAAEWKKSWADFYEKFQAGQSDDPFAAIEYERRKKLEDAWDNYVRDANRETIDQVNAYYDAQRGGAIKKLADEEDRMRRELSRTKVDDLGHELRQALEAIDAIEARRVTAAADSEGEMAAIRERFAAMRGETELQFKIKVDQAELEEAREAVKDWQQELSDGLTRTLMDIEGFGAKAAVTVGDLAAQLSALSASASLSGFEEFGRALGEGRDAAESLGAALAAMCRQILQQLPTMFLQAGLQLIANGQWAIGLGFVAAAGSTAVISGYVGGASKHAQGGVFDEHGRAARAFAAGGAFTNQVVSAPTYFRYGGGFGLGLMGEAGPEAVVPLARMGDGSLGIRTGGGDTRVVVNIINKSGAEVRQEEHEDGHGNKQVDVFIGEMVNRHIASGKADRTIKGRYGLSAVGV